MGTMETRCKKQSFLFNIKRGEIFWQRLLKTELSGVDVDVVLRISN